MPKTDYSIFFLGATNKNHLFLILVVPYTQILVIEDSDISNIRLKSFNCQPFALKALIFWFRFSRKETGSLG